MMKLAMSVLCCMGATSDIAAYSGSFEVKSPIIYSIRQRGDLGGSFISRGLPAQSPKGTVCVRDGNLVYVKELAGGWETHNIIDAETFIRSLALGIDVTWDRNFDKSRMVSNDIVFNSEGDAFTILTPRHSNLDRALLLFSRDGCRTWGGLPLTGRSAVLEKPDAFNDHSGVPTVLSFEGYGPYMPGRLWLERFKVEKGTVRPVASRLIGKDTNVTPIHSGGGNLSFTRGDRIFVVFPRALNGNLGTLQFVQTFDRGTLRPRSHARLVGSSFTAVGPDVHDLPAITMTLEGRLRIILGGHHAALGITEGKVPMSIDGGWTPIYKVASKRLQTGEVSSFTYPGVNTSLNGDLNIFARFEGRGYRFELAQIRLGARSDISTIEDAALMRILATNERRNYAAWRNQASFNPKTGALFLNFRFWPNELNDQERSDLNLPADGGTNCRNGRCWYGNVPDINPLTLVSEDGGSSWTALSN